MRFIIFIILALLLTSYLIQAEENDSELIRQWATRATASSEYSSPEWAAIQATGEPDTFDCVDIGTAWASADSYAEASLTVYFDEPVFTTQVNIHQTYTPGSITSIELLQVNGTSVQVPQSSDPVTDCPRVFSLNIDLPEIGLVEGVTIHLNQDIGGSWNEIDAVELVGYKTTETVIVTLYAETTAEPDALEPEVTSEPSVSLKTEVAPPQANDSELIRQWATLAMDDETQAATGEWDTFICDDEQPTVWSSFVTGEPLTLYYEKPVSPLQVNIYQISGLIPSIELLSTDGSVIVQDSNSTYWGDECPHVFSVNIDSSDIGPINGIRIYVDGRFTSIDAVELVGLPIITPDPSIMLIQPEPTGYEVITAENTASVQHVNLVYGLPPVQDIAFSPRGNLLAAAVAEFGNNVDAEVIFFSVPDLVEQSRFSIPLVEEYGYISPILAFSPDGTKLAVGHETYLSVWDVSTEQPLYTIEVDDDLGLQSLSFSPDGSLLAFTGVANPLGLLDVTSGRLLDSPKTPQTSWGDYADFYNGITPDGEFLLAVSESAYSWDGGGFNLGQVVLYAIRPDGFWNVQSIFTRPDLSVHNSDSFGLNHVRFSPQGDLIASSSGRGIRLWNIDEERLATVLMPYQLAYDHFSFEEIAIDFSPNGNLVVATERTSDNTLLFDIANGQIIRELTGHSEQPLSLKPIFSPDGSLIASAGGSDGAIYLYGIPRPVNAFAVTSEVIEGYYDRWTDITFEGLAGETITITLQAISGSFDPEISLFLTSPSGEHIFIVANDNHDSDDFDLTFVDARINQVRLRESGSYLLLVMGMGYGEYRLTIDRIPPMNISSETITSLDAPGQLIYAAGSDAPKLYRMSTSNLVNPEMLTNSNTSERFMDVAADGSIVLTRLNNENEFWDVILIHPDGESVQLTRDMGNNYRPTFSPDGTQILFVSDRDGNSEIYLMASDGSNQRRLTVNSIVDDFPVWSPDGSRILFSSNRTGNADLYLMDTTGQISDRLTNNADTEVNISWSPDGSQVVFSVLGEENLADIFVLDLTNNQTTILTDGGLNLSPTWSPDGHYIAFISDRDGGQDIYIMEADGANVRRISQTTELELFVHWVNVP